jgi:hypothetical protein
MQHILLNGIVRTIKEGRDVGTVIATLRQKGYTVEKCNKPPTIKTLEKWVSDGVAKATDGCKVELDGVCGHGCKSWPLVMGLV